MVIGIIGIGLIGSSLARAFKHHALGELAIYDHSEIHLDQAKELDLGTHYYDTLKALAQKCDIIFVCVPVDRIVGVVKDICPHLKAGAIISDVGSVKSEITKEVQSFLPRDISFVPGHPISGTEHSGPKSGKADLFLKRPYVLIEEAGSKEATQKIGKLLEIIGAEVCFLDADAHDIILAFTSHLPHIAAFSAMVGSEKVSLKLGNNALNYAGGSFRDLTRVAASGSDIWMSIFLSNQKHILEAYKLFRHEMDHLVSLIESSDADKIKAYIEHAKELRQKKYL